MRRLLILFSALPIIASLVLAHLLGWRVLNKRVNLALSLQQILEKLRNSGVDYTVKKRVWQAMPLAKTGEAYITEKHLNSTDSQIVSAELLKVGFAEINKTHPSMVQWRCKVLKASYFLPPFTLLVGILAIAARRPVGGWSIAIFALVLAGCCAMLWLSRGVEKEAATAVSNLLERKRTINRLSEEEALVGSIHAWTWISILPGIIVTLMMKINQAKDPKDTE